MEPVQSQRRLSSKRVSYGCFELAFFGLFTIFVTVLASFVVVEV